MQPLGAPSTQATIHLNTETSEYLLVWNDEYSRIMASTMIITRHKDTVKAAHEINFIGKGIITIPNDFV